MNAAARLRSCPKHGLVPDGAMVCPWCPPGRPGTSALAAKPTDPRAFAQEAADAVASAPIVRTYCCSKCGLPTRVTRSLEEHAALLANVGWRIVGGEPVCPPCVAGDVRRIVIGSKGDLYVLRPFNGSWSCSCQGFLFRGKCKHADATNAAHAAGAT